ncbi:MAG: ADP-ribosylation factor-like protein [Promethearchaeota archaeon]
MTKVVFAGLANAGKSSIILTVDEEMEKLDGLKPTLGVETSTFRFLGLPFFRWDLGGQKKFIKKYVNNAERYFAETGLLIYVIDVQDLREQTIKETISYFKEIRKAYKKLRESPVVAVFFHKYDPNLQNKAEIDEKIATLEADCKKIFSEEDVYTYKTSIKSPNELRRTFISAIKIVFPKARVLDRQLDELGAQYGAQFIYVYDSRQIQIAQQIEEGVDIDAINLFNVEVKPLVGQAFSGKPGQLLKKDFERGMTVVVDSFEHNEERYAIAASLPNGLAMIDEALDACLTNCKNTIVKTLTMFD